MIQNLTFWKKNPILDPKWGFSKILMMVGCSAHKMGLLNQFQFLKLKFFSKSLGDILLKERYVEL